MHIHRTLLAAAALALAAVPAAAITFDYDAIVTQSPGPATAPGEPDFPPVGASASISLEVDDSDPGQTIADALASGRLLATAILTVPGYLEAYSDTFPPENVTVNETTFSFQANLPTALNDPGDIMESPFGINSFRSTFGTPALWPPTTVGELIANISAPGFSGSFNAQIEDAETGIFYNATATFDTAVPVVPLPATGLLLAGAIGAAAALRRRR